jgi:DNA-binding NarL/FixJ family response regulator
MMIRIVVADDEMIVRAAFRFMLERRLDDVRVRCAAHADPLLEAVGRRCPDVVILDWELPGKDPAQLINTLRSLCPDTHLVITSTRPSIASQAIEAGADKLVNKGEPPDALINYLQQIARA